MSKKKSEKDHADETVNMYVSSGAEHDLALYNAECSRGIVHTPEWDKRMAVLQKRYDDRVVEEARLQSEDFVYQSLKKVNVSRPPAWLEQLERQKDL